MILSNLVSYDKIAQHIGNLALEIASQACLTLWLASVDKTQVY